jgi:hypothetical protein
MHTPRRIQSTETWPAAPRAKRHRVKSPASPLASQRDSAVKRVPQDHRLTGIAAMIQTTKYPYMDITFPHMEVTSNLR